jgi:integrase
VRGPDPGPLFPRLDPKHQGQRLDGDSICRLVKRAVALIGIDPEDYGAHSLRAGFVTAAGEANVGELLIAAQTGHSSMQVLRRYFRKSEIWKNNACGRLGL